MSSHFSLYYFSIAVIFFSMLLVGIQWSKGVPRNQSFYLMTAINVLGVVGSTFVAINFLNTGSTYFYGNFSDTSDLALRKYIFLGGFLLGGALILQPLYFRSLRKRVTKKVFLYSALLLVFLFLISFGAVKYGSFLNRSLVAHLYSVITLTWLSFEVRKNNQRSEAILMHFLNTLSLAVIAAFLIWMAVISIALMQGSFGQFSLDEISNFELNFRFLRVALLLYIQLVILLNWTETYSHNALKVRARDEEIRGLLLEKDLLIQNLSNSNALIETGALAAGLAHELNQYLARIQLNADEALSRLNDSGVDPKAADSLERIAVANQQAARLILSLKKIFKNPYEKKAPIKMDELVSEVIGLYQDRARKSAIQFVADLSTTGKVIFADSLMRQIISNLIANAIDSLDSIAKEGKQIHIALSETSTEIRLEVSDNGPGIHPDKVKSLFEIFKTTKHNGAGIGLWLCKYLVEAGGGKIYAKSQASEGVVFTVELPLSPESSFERRI